MSSKEVTEPDLVKVLSDIVAAQRGGIGTREHSIVEATGLAAHIVKGALETLVESGFVYPKRLQTATGGTTSIFFYPTDGLKFVWVSDSSKNY